MFLLGYEQRCESRCLGPQTENLGSSSVCYHLSLLRLNSVLPTGLFLFYFGTWTHSIIVEGVWSYNLSSFKGVSYLRHAESISSLTWANNLKNSNRQCWTMSSSFCQRTVGGGVSFSPVCLSILWKMQYLPNCAERLNGLNRFRKFTLSYFHRGVEPCYVLLSSADTDKSPDTCACPLLSKFN